MKFWWHLTGLPQTWKTWSTRVFLWIRKTQGILCNLREILTNKIVSVRWNIGVTQQGLGLQMNSLMNFGDGHSAFVTCYIAGVDVDCGMTLDIWQIDAHYIYFLLQWLIEKYSLWLWKKTGKLGKFFSPTLWSPCLTLIFNLESCLQIFLREKIACNLKTAGQIPMQFYTQ